MDIKTHKETNESLIGTPIEVVDGASAKVELLATQDMAVDSRGLVHGGFTFSLADYSAMLAVNHPNVVLGASRSRFLAPAKIGDLMVASATVGEVKGRKYSVEVVVFVNDNKIFKGEFDCYVLDSHVFDNK